MLEELFKQVRTRLSDEAPAKRQPEPGYKCPRCRTTSPTATFHANLRVCPACGFHDRMPSHERILLLCDHNSFQELDGGMRSANPIAFPGYDKKQMLLRADTGLDDAIVTGTALLDGIPFALGVMDARYMMGSMGSVVGERITRLFEYATEHGLPVVLCTASGGARMQEGAVSLMQMAKTAGAVKLHSDAGLLYVTLLTDPTTGGVTASFASLGDILLAEPKVLIGFAGRRVIEDTIRQRLPDDFQLAEHLLEHGFLDAIVTRQTQRDQLASILRLHGYGEGEA